jgi:hypothetical protein
MIIARTTTMNELDLERNFPGIPWREPILVTGADAGGLGCRFCIALTGLKAEEIPGLPQDRAAFTDHMARHHLPNLNGHAD